MINRHRIGSSGNNQSERYMAMSHHVKLISIRWLQWWSTTVKEQENVG